MAAYPTTPEFRTVIRPLTRTRTFVSESGVPRQQNLGEETAFRIEVVHPFITSAQVSTLQTFYNTNAYNDNTIVGNDGDTYDVLFETDYEIIFRSPTLFDAKCVLVGTRQ